MKAMILAAGRGERMRPLTDTTPKPLLMVGDFPLIVWHIKRLAKAGFNEIIINHAWLGEQIEAVLGDGSHWSVSIKYSPEQAGGLETAGGIATALPLLGEDFFLVINGDIFTDIDFSRLRLWKNQPQAQKTLAHLILTNNPEHHPEGDFALTPEGLVYDPMPETSTECFTFSGVGIYHPNLFLNIKKNERAKLAPLLREAMQEKSITGERHTGLWIDVGTMERLAHTNEIAKKGFVL